MTEKNVDYLEALDLITGWEEKLTAAGVDLADIEAVKSLINTQNDEIDDLEERINWYGSSC